MEPEVLDTEIDPTDPLSMFEEEQRTKIEEWKAKGLDVNVGPIAGKMHFFRSLNRMEWKKLMDDQASRAQAENVTAQDLQMAMEEAVACMCSLDPVISRENVKLLPAGIVSTIAEWVMYSSGFNQEAMPIKL